jgi:hypothetical protein
MSSSAGEMREALATQVEVDEDSLRVELADGRTIAVPLAWSAAGARRGRGTAVMAAPGRRAGHPLARAG